MGFPCITKPVKQSELLDAVRSALEVPHPSGAQPVPVTPAPARRQALHVLLVEDNPVNRRMAQHVLEKEGYRVEVADNGTMALQALERERFDLILMDVQMPRMDGIETTGAIREREKTTGEHVPIVALTAHAMAGDRERCLGAGMDGYLIKPIRPTTLLEAIERLQLPSRGQPERGSGPRVIIDRTELLDRVNGDLRLLGEITGIFQRECGPLMASVHEAMEKRDAGRFACEVHTLRGMFRSLSAVAAQEAAASLEGLDFKSPEKLRASYALLAQEAQALASELLVLTRETAVAPGVP